MKSLRFILCCNILSLLFFSSCSRPGTQVWDDTKSCTRHMKRGLCSLGGKQGDSRQVHSREDFMCHNDSAYSVNDEFIPLDDCENKSGFAITDNNRQARQSPGDPGSSIPGIEAFKDPQEIQLGNIFQRIHFDYDSSNLKGDENLGSLNRISKYMKNNPNVYVFIEGHCDERGAEAYNLALGAKRANSVRNALIKEGVSPDNLFTISYGKERPLTYGHNEKTWAQNRRAEFKVYQR